MVVLSGSALFTVFFLYFLAESNFAMRAENTTTLSSQGQSGDGLPVNIKIPSIHVDAPFEYVGLTPDGAMDVPKGPREVAWLNLGPRPGETGSSVIAGHYGWKSNIPAVFDNLHTLREGDEIYVENKEGTVVTFIVREIRMYNKDEDASEVFSSSDGKAHLNLVTCTGAWNKTEESYSDRLVVFADREL